MDNVIFVDSNNGRFANQLFPLFVALTIFERERSYIKIYFKNYWDYHDTRRIKDSIIENFTNELKEIVCFDNTIFDEKWEEYKNNTDNFIIISGWCQKMELIDTNVIQKYFKCPENVKNKIYDLYGDISQYVCLHIRRGDYLNYNDKYIILTVEYINKCIDKYFPNEKIICISDDILWCKKNLNNSQIVFADKKGDVEVDFYIQTLTKGNICSASTFSIAGSIIAPHRKMIIPYPFFKIDLDYINLYPSWAEREYIKI